MAYQTPRLTGDFRESVRTSLEKIDSNILELYNANPGTIEWASLVNSAVPAVDNAIDLGASGQQWRNLYASSIIIAGGTVIGVSELGALTVDGASISTTINYVDIVGTPDLSGYATTSSVSSAISSAVSALVDTAPTTLDTLNEFAAALGNDANFSTTITTALGNKANTVDLAVSAFSGSYNDLTNTPDPAAAFDQDLNTTADVTFNSITTDTFASAGAGAPEIASDTTVSIITDAGNTAQTWLFDTNGTLTFPDSSIQLGAAISIADLKVLVAASTDFADFQTRIAAL